MNGQSTYVTPEVSRKMRLLSFVAALAVVIIHSNSLEDIRDPAWAGWLGNLIGYAQRWAVPYFFMVTGFFFDRGFASSDKPFVAFLKTKLRSLGVPYLVWGVIYGVLLMTPILILVNKSHGDPLFQKTILDWQGFFPFVDRLIGVHRAGPPNGALWYVRLLILFFAFAPIWRLLRKYARWSLPALGVAFLVFGAPFVSGFECESLFGVGFHLAGFGYILLGMSVSSYALEARRLPLSAAIMGGGIWLIAIVLSLVYGSSLAFIKISPILLLLVIWRLFDFVEPIVARVSPRLISLTFLIYCVHHPLTAYVGAVIHMVLGKSLTVEVVRMFISAPITIALAMGIGLFLQQFRFCDVLTGGRN